jgi:hypothetical protein
MKNNKILGIPLTVLVIGLVVLGGASALIVNYLSNTANATVEVNSPLAINFANIDGAVDENGAFNIDGSWTPTLTMASTTGLNTEQIGVKVDNNADVPIENKWLQLKVTNENSDVTCNDLTSLKFMDTATPTQIAKGFQELSSLCVADTGFVVYNIDINSLAAGQTYIYPVNMTWGLVAPQTYTFEATLLDTINTGGVPPPPPPPPII